MGFLWFGKNIDSWQDIGDEKELKAQVTKLELEWQISLTKKEETQRLWEQYGAEARKEGIAQSRKERALHEMSRLSKRQRRLDEEIDLIKSNLETAQGVLSIKDAERRDQELSKVFGSMDADKLQDTIIAASQARKGTRDFAKELNTIVKSQSPPIRIDVEKDEDYLAALKYVEGSDTP